MNYDTEQIKTIKSGAETHFGTFHSNCDTVDSYYNQEMDLGDMPSDVTLYIPPTVRQHVNDAVFHLLSLGQTVYVPPWGESENIKKLITKLRIFGNAFLSMMDRMYDNVRHDCYKHGILYGAFCLKGPIYVPRLRSDKMSEKEWNASMSSTFPFYYEATPPRNLMWAENQWVLESCRKRASDIKSQLPDWDDEGRGPFEEVNWAEFWTPSQKVYMIDGDPVNLGEGGDRNIYGFIPYQIKSTGFGIKGATGKIEDRYVSMIAPALDSYKIEARTKTAIFAGQEYGVYGRPMADRPLEEGESLSLSPGELSIVRADANLRNFEVPPVTEDAYKTIALVKEDQQRIIPDIAHGMGMKYETGYGQAGRIRQSWYQLIPLKNAWESAVSACLDNNLELMKSDGVVDEPVGILNDLAGEKSIVSIKPTEINPTYQHFYVKLDNQTPEEKERRIRLGLDQYVVGAIDLETYLTEYANHDFMTIRQRKLIQEALNHPAIKSALAQAAMEDAGMREVLRMIEEGEQMEQRRPLHGVGTQANTQMSLSPGTQGFSTEEEQ